MIERPKDQKGEDGYRASLLKMVAATLLLGGISTCVDVTWTWIEKRPNRDTIKVTTIGAFDGLVGYQDGVVFGEERGDGFGEERAGFEMKTHKPSIQPPFFAFGWMDGTTIGVSTPVAILCVMSGIYGLRAYRRRSRVQT